MTNSNLANRSDSSRDSGFRHPRARRRFLGFCRKTLDLGHIRRSQLARAYMTGLLFLGNKSMTGIAERLHCSDQALQHFISNAPWQASASLWRAARLGQAAALKAGAGIDAWIIDDTSQAKWGRNSPGVARQYMGRWGVINNCQVYPTLHLATSRGAFPIAVSLSICPRPGIRPGPPLVLFLLISLIKVNGSVS